MAPTVGDRRKGQDMTKQCEACQEFHSRYALTDAIGWTTSVMCLECVDVWIEQGHMTRENILETNNENDNN